MKFVLLLLPLLALVSCTSTSGKKEPPNPMSQKMASRLTKPDLTRRSVFDKSMQASLKGKSDAGSWFSKQKHSAKSFTGAKPFTQTSAFKTSEYTRADSKNRMGKQDFADAGRKPDFADETFATPENRMARQMAPEGTQTFQGSDNVFRTNQEYDAAASQRKNVRPTFIQLEEHAGNPAYTEDQVRKLLGRD